MITALEVLEQEMDKVVTNGFTSVDQLKISSDLAKAIFKKACTIYAELAILENNKNATKSVNAAHVCHICGGSNGHTIECTAWCGNTVTV